MKSQRSLVVRAAVVLAAVIGLGRCETAWAQTPQSSPSAPKVILFEQNINSAVQEANVTGCAEAINQVIVQTSLNFNLIFQGFTTNPLDPSTLFQDLNLSKLIPPFNPPSVVPNPACPPEMGEPAPQVTNQTIVETGININEAGAIAPSPVPDGITLTVTDLAGTDQSQVEQQNLNIACQFVTGTGTVASIDQTVTQNEATVNRVITPADNLTLADLINAIHYTTTFLHTHTDGTCCTGAGGMSSPEVIVNQTIVQTGLNFNIIALASGVDLPLIHQSNSNEVPCQLVTVVPEPASLALLGWGISGLAVARRRKKGK